MDTDQRAALYDVFIASGASDIESMGSEYRFNLVPDSIAQAADSGIDLIRVTDQVIKIGPARCHGQRMGGKSPAVEFDPVFP
jgi:hypothetical protein